MGHYRFSVHVDASPEQAFALWTDLDRMREWVGGVTGVRDVTGPVDQVGTRYTTLFGSMSSPTEVVGVERPRLFRTRFGNRVLRGETQAVFESDANGTLLTQEFWTQGLVPALMARIFATGSYKGSFRGELHEFARIAAADARKAGSDAG
jgi:uncharacterized protein YndB with AHSA1/START domain